MRVLGPIIQVAALPMLNLGEQLAVSDAIAAQLVGHDDPRLILQTLQQSLEKALCGIGVTAWLNQDVEHNTILVDSTPEVVLNTLDPDENLIHVPFIAWPRPPVAHAISERRGKFPAPAPDRLIGDNDAALSQNHLNIPQTEAEDVVQPDGVADNLSGEAMSIVRIRRRLHAVKLA
jgi:hypothetical protein